MLTGILVDFLVGMFLLICLASVCANVAFFWWAARGIARRIIGG